MSPASENTLINSLVESGLDVIDDDLSESFLETISESESDSELGEEFLDDTDEDPDFIPGTDNEDSDEDIELAQEWLQQKNATNTAGGDGRVINVGCGNQFGVEPLPGKKERECVVCSPVSIAGGGKRKRSRTACVKCKRGLHGGCL
ncbi:hypothetical protein J6590_106445 [Homalodisca vitripennis]|nr:hypothetical protein J6590_106445 [Homalodisca vitripennis]